MALIFVVGLKFTGALDDGCPKGEYACLDVINASQCIEQLVIEKQRPATKENLVKCVEHEGTASTIPGASKVCERDFDNDMFERLLRF